MTAVPMQVTATTVVLGPVPGVVPDIIDIFGVSVAVLPDDTALVSAWTSHDQAVHVWHLTPDGDQLDHVTIAQASITTTALAATPAGAILLTHTGGSTTTHMVTTHPLTVVAGVTQANPDGLDVHDMPATTADGRIIFPRLSDDALVHDGTSIVGTVALPEAWGYGAVTPDAIATTDPYTVRSFDGTILATMSTSLDHAWAAKGVPTADGWGWVGEWRTDNYPAFTLLNVSGGVLASHAWDAAAQEYGRAWAGTATAQGRGYVTAVTLHDTGPVDTRVGRVYLYRTGGTDPLEHLHLPHPGGDERAMILGSSEYAPVATNGRRAVVAMATQRYAAGATTQRDVALHVWSVRVGATPGILHIDTLDEPFWLVGTRDPHMAKRLRISDGVDSLIEILAGQEDQATYRLRVCDVEGDWPVAAYLRPL